MTARVCSGCGAPIVGQPPVVVDTVVADTVVGAVGDVAGEAVPAAVAGQALPEPYVPGSGARVPAKLRLVLGGYAGIGIAIGIACLSAGGMALASGLDPDAVFLGLLVCSVGVGVPLITLSGFWRLLRLPQRSAYGHGAGLEAWWTHADTRHHPPGWHRAPRVPVAVRGESRVVAEGRHAGAR